MVRNIDIKRGNITSVDEECSKNSWYCDAKYKQGERNMKQSVIDEDKSVEKHY